MEGTAAEGTQGQTATAERPETMYLVLRQSELGDGEGTKAWVEVGVAGGGPVPAMKALVEEPGTYAAVPVRSWKPREVKVESKPTVTFA